MKLEQESTEKSKRKKGKYKKKLKNGDETVYAYEAISKSGKELSVE